jgi:hypothetical protein
LKEYNSLKMLPLSALVYWEGLCIDFKTSM